MSSAAIIFAEQLVGRGHGLPLWRPEPTKFGEVLIGDVGFVDEGAFYRLFNAMRRQDDPINRRGVPEEFVVLSVNLDDLLHTDEEYLSPGPVHTATTTAHSLEAGAGAGCGSVVYGQLVISCYKLNEPPHRNVADASYAFNCQGTKGAIAVLGGCGRQERILRNRTFYDYIRRYHSSWCAFAESKGHMLQPSAIVLVSGYVKTSEWALATINNYQRSHSLSFSASVGAYASAKFRYSADRDVQMSMEQRCGPRRINFQSTEGHLPMNQCLFLRYYKIKNRLIGPPKVIVQADYKDILDSTDEGSSFRSPLGPSSSSRGISSWSFGRAHKDGQRSRANDTAPELDRPGSSSSTISVQEIPETSEDMVVSCVVHSRRKRSSARIIASRASRIPFRLHP